MAAGRVSQAAFTLVFFAYPPQLTLELSDWLQITLDKPSTRLAMKSVEPIGNALSQACRIKMFFSSLVLKYIIAVLCRLLSDKALWRLQSFCYL